MDFCALVDEMREVPRGAGMTPAGEAGEAEMGKWSVELVWSISHLRQLYLSIWLF